MAEDTVEKYKVLVLGNINVGKTSTLIRLTENTFEEGTLRELDQVSKEVTVGSVTVKLLLPDTAGQERFNTLTSSFFRNTDALVVVFARDDRESFTDISKWLEGVPLVVQASKYLVMNKIDITAGDDLVNDQEASQAAEKHDAQFKKMSAKTGEGVEDLFVGIAEHLVANRAPTTAEPEKPKKPKKSCCVS